MKTQYIASGSIPDGYFGDRQDVHFVFDDEEKLTFTVFPGGWFRSFIGMTETAEEAIWRLQNVPHIKSHVKNLIIKGE